MGAARLRISSFPVIGNGSDAHEWVTPRNTVLGISLQCLRHD